MCYVRIIPCTAITNTGRCCWSLSTFIFNTIFAIYTFSGQPTLFHHSSSHVTPSWAASALTWESVFILPYTETATILPSMPINSKHTLSFLVRVSTIFLTIFSIGGSVSNFALIANNNTRFCSRQQVLQRPTLKFRCLLPHLIHLICFSIAYLSKSWADPVTPLVMLIFRACRDVFCLPAFYFVLNCLNLFYIFPQNP